VLGQTFENFEFLVIDDGSTDNLGAALSVYTDPRLHYFRHENRGEAGTTNRGWAMARGEYFAVLSSDDPVLPRWLERTVQFLDENPDVLVVYPDWRIIDDASKVVEEVRTLQYDFETMVAWFYTLPGPGALIRRSAIRDVMELRNPRFKYAPDLDCWLRLGLRGRFARLPETLACWRRHSGSITVADRTLARAQEMVTIASEFFARDDLPAAIRRLEPFAMSRAYSTAAWVVQPTRPLRAARYVRKAYAASPVESEDLKPELRRPPRPLPREIARLMRNSAKARAFPWLRRIGRRLPLGLRVAGANMLVRAGVVEMSSLMPPAAISLQSSPIADVAYNALSKPDLAMRFDELRSTLAEDLGDLCNTVSPLTPTDDLVDRLRSHITPLFSSPIPSATARILDRVPAQIDHLLIVPWVGPRGGSETVTTRLIETLSRHYGSRRLCIIAPDNRYTGTLETHLGVPLVGFSGIEQSLDDSARLDILNRIVVQRRPRNIHCINSQVGWMALRERAAAYALDSNLFVNIYSDIRLRNGTPAASYFYDFLPHCMPHVTGVIADNEVVKQRAVEYFGLSATYRDKIHIVRTPVLGIRSRDPRQDLRPFRRQSESRSLWLSRIAPEKRPDVMAAVARRMPDRDFVLYGSSNGFQVDMSELESAPNVKIRGEFEELDDIPIDEFDSYVFTTSGEGVPVALLEMAARGLPIVAPDVGAIRELVNLQTGWLISHPEAIGEYARAISEIHANPNEAQRRVEAAQAYLLQHHSRESFERALKTVPSYLGSRS